MPLWIDSGSRPAGPLAEAPTVHLEHRPVRRSLGVGIARMEEARLELLAMPLPRHQRCPHDLIHSVGLEITDQRGPMSDGQ